MPTNVSGSEPQEQVQSLPPVVTREAKDSRDEISLLDLLIIVAEQKNLVIKIIAICTVLAIVTSFVLPKRYTATVTLLPPQQNSSLSTALTSQLGSLGSVAALTGGGGGLSLKNPNDMYVGMLKSRTVEDAIIQRFGLMQEYRRRYISDARRDLERRTTIDGNGKDNLIHISIEDSDPNRAAELANGYIEQFRKLSEHLAITEASRRRLFFEQQLEEAKDKLGDAEEALKKTEQSTGLIQLDSQARALIESAASLRAQIAAKEVQIEGMQTYATGENAQLLQAQRELDGLRSQLTKLGGLETGSEASIIVPRGQVPQAGLEYVRRLRDVKYYETIFDILARQFEVAKLDEAKQGSVVQLVDPAVPPDKRSSPKRVLIWITGAIVGLFIGIFAALLSSAFRRLEADPVAGVKLHILRRALSRRGAV
jgi:tyrosine-protein kinase Etk/Wzc